MSELETFWEGKYGESGQIWSGRANRVLADVAATLTPGRALDLGCGEGGDALWLAEQGWFVVGLDVSRTAVDRARAQAETQGVAERAEFVVGDLSDWAEAGPVAVEGRDLVAERFDLVTASFFHSPVEVPRAGILRAAATLVAPQGHLLITSHRTAPPWAHADQSDDGHDGHGHDGHDHSDLLSPEEEIAELALDPELWATELCEVREREATGPNGETATLEDGVVLLHRTR